MASVRERLQNMKANTTLYRSETAQRSSQSVQDRLNNMKAATQNVATSAGLAAGIVANQAARQAVHGRAGAALEAVEREMREIEQADHTGKIGSSSITIASYETAKRRMEEEEQPDPELLRRYEALQTQRDGLRDAAYWEDRDQLAAALESVQNNSDFQDVVSRTRGDIYLSGNVFTGDAQARNTVRDIQLLNRDESGEWAKANFDNAVLYMTPEQQDTMLYYAGTNQWDKATEYLDSIEHRLNAQQAQELAESTREVSENNPLLGALTNISAGFLTPLSWLDTAGHTVVSGITGEYTPTDPNSQMHIGPLLSQSSREGVMAAAEQMPLLGDIEIGGRNLGSEVAGVGLSIGQVASRLPFGGAGALALSAGSAAGEQSYNVLQRGGTQGQAALSGLASGLIEAATEKIGLDNLFSIFGRTGRQGVRQVLSDVARQAGIEATEEAISEVAHNLADIAIMGENSELNQYILQLEQQGMDPTQARNEALKQFFLANTAWAAAGGALSGGVMGGGASAVNATQNRVTLPTAEQGGRLPGGETVQTEQQIPTTQTAQQNNTASTGETVNGLVPITDRDAISLSTGRNNIIARKASDIINFVRNAIQKRGGPERLYMGTIPDSAAQTILDSTGVDVAGYSAILPGDSVQHIVRNHGNARTEEARGNQAVTEEDIALIPQVISSPDSVVLSDRADVLGRPVLLISKQIGNTYVTAQAVTDGRHALTTNSLWIKKGKNPTPIPDAGMSTNPEGNARSALESSSSKNSIPQNAQNVNAQVNNTASTGETESTIVNTDPRVHTPQEQAVISEYQDSTDESLKETFESYLNNPSQSFSRYNISNVSERQATDASRLLGGNYNGYKNAINSNGIIHILNEHGPTGTTDHSLSDLNDAARIGFVLDNYDNVDAVEYESGDPDYSREFRTSDNRPAPMLKFSKKVNGTYYVIEAIPEAKYKKFWVVSAYMQTADGGTQAPNANGPRNTPNASLASSPSAIENSIPQTGQNVNTQANENVEGVRGVPVSPESSVGAAESGFDPYTHMLNEYGAIPEGENPARVIDVPVSTDGDDRVSRAARTVMEAEATPDSMLGDIAEAIANGELSHEVLTDKAAMSQARNIVETEGFANALAQFKNQVSRGNGGKNTVALGQVLLNNAMNGGDPRVAIDILTDYATLATQAGQALQAQRIFKKLSPEGQLYGIQRSVLNLQNEMQKRFPDRTITIDPDLIEEFNNQTDQAGRDAVMDKIYQNVADQVPSTWREKWNAWRYMAMLFNPRTHVRNVMGNLLFQPVRFVKDRIASGVESLVGAVNPNFQRTKSFATNPALYKAAWKDFTNVRDVLSGNKYDDVGAEINRRRTIFRSPVGRPLELARKGNSWALEFEDTIFKRITYADSLAGYLQSNGVTAQQLASGEVNQDLLTRARDYAGQEALRATYQDRNQFSDLLSRRFQEDNTAAKVANAAIDAVLPFRRTPANILVRGFEYSPIGFVNGVKEAVWDVHRGNKTAAEAIDHIAAGLTGSGLFALGMYLLAQGIVTSGGDEDKEQNDLNELTGVQNYALNLPGGGSVTLDWLAPEALPFFMGVELMDAVGEDGFSGLDDIMGALSSISEPMLELSMLQSLNDLIDSVSYAESSGKLVSMAGSALISYLTQAIPTLGGQIERTTEENRMSSFTDRNSSVPRDVQYAISRSSARLPGDYQQIPYIDAWGRTESSGNILERAFNNLLNPAYTSTVNQTAADEEIQRLLDAGMTGVVPDRVSQSQKVDDQYMTADEYVEYATTRGQTSYEIVSDMIDSDLYRRMTDEQKADALKRAYQYASHVAAESIHPGHESEAYVTEAQQADSAAEYLLLYEKYGSSGTKRYSELMDAGLDGEAAETVLDTMDGLTGDVTSIQRYRAIVDSGISESDQMAALSQYMTESEYRKLSAGYDYGVSPDDYITFRETLPSFDENGNGSFTQAETEAALNSLSGSGLILPSFTGVNLTNDQKAVLWQLQGKNWSWKNNPYSTSIGRQVYNALNSEESEDFSWMLNLPRA